jgi:hypothetical protein
MADKFRALLATKEGARQSVAVTELTDADLMDAEVTVAVEHSTVNYKTNHHAPRGPYAPILKPLSPDAL